MNPRWEDVRGKSVGFHTVISMLHSTQQPVLEQLTMLSSGEGTELALGPIRKSPTEGFFLGPFSVALGGSPPFKEKLRVRGTCHSAAKRWDFNHII